MDTVELEVKISKTIKISIQVGEGSRYNIGNYIDEEIDRQSDDILEQVREKIEIEDCDIDLT